jgi:choline dehydrogenase-like flavoprotein
MAIIDAQALPEGTEIEADLIIIGGGLAGIAIARQFVGTNKTVAILESGGREMEEATQELYRGSASVGAPDNETEQTDRYTYESRFRALGGSGNIWGGKCVPLDESDFAQRDWIPHSGWPFTRAQLQPYYDRACELLEIPAFNRDFDHAPDPERPPMLINGARDFFSAPRWFSPLSGGNDRAKFEAFCTSFAEAPNINVYLHANVIAMRRTRNGRSLSRLDVACLNGRRHTARGRSFVLATGGIENVRLLLASDIGNDWVGRCFQGHMNYGVSEAADGRNSSIAISDPSRNMTLYTSNRGPHCTPASTLEGQRRYRIPNFTVSIFDGSETLPADAQALLNLSGPIDQGAGVTPARNMSCYFKTEQHPNPESRITLDPANVDALGMPRVNLDWKFTSEDLDQLERAVDAFAAQFGAEGLGRVCWPQPRNRLVAIMSPARHHMGTTRMAVDEDEGAVDAHGRIHGMRNLYIAGSSVFPTSGNANPTLTIIALTMRMSDHLKRELGVRQ